MYHGIQNKYFVDILPLRDVILEVRSVTDHKTLLCPFFLPVSVSDECGRAREHWRSTARLGCLVSLWQTVPALTCSCRYQILRVPTLCPEKLACPILIVLSCSNPVLGCPGLFPK